MYYSQKSYPKTKLGTCSVTIASSGCFITSFCNILKRLDIADLTPDKFNTLAKKNGWYADGCSFLPAKAAAYFGLTYTKQIKKPSEVCIAETNYYTKLGFPQHFFLLKPKENQRIDPLDLEPSWEVNNYPIVSYRIFTKIPVKKSEVKQVAVQELKTKPRAVFTPITTIAEDAKAIEPAQQLAELQSEPQPAPITEYQQSEVKAQPAETVNPDPTFWEFNPELKAIEDNLTPWYEKILTWLIIKLK